MTIHLTSQGSKLPVDWRQTFTGSVSLELSGNYPRVWGRGSGKVRLRFSRPYPSSESSLLCLPNVLRPVLLSDPTSCERRTKTLGSPSDRRPRKSGEDWGNTRRLEPRSDLTDRQHGPGWRTSWSPKIKKKELIN